MTERCYYFGVSRSRGLSSGHRLNAAAGTPEAASFGPIARCDNDCHIDGALAPRRHRDTGGVMCIAQGATQESRQRLDYDSSELPQGRYLLHHLANGFTAIQWWDRCQGDSRMGCNSTILLEGKRDNNEMLAALLKYFPHVAENLTKAGITLTEVHLTKP